MTTEDDASFDYVSTELMFIHEVTTTETPDETPSWLPSPDSAQVLRWLDSSAPTPTDQIPTCKTSPNARSTPSSSPAQAALPTTASHPCSIHHIQQNYKNTVPSPTTSHSFEICSRPASLQSTSSARSSLFADLANAGIPGPWTDTRGDDDADALMSAALMIAEATDQM